MSEATTVVVEARGIGVDSLRTFMAAHSDYLLIDFTGLSLYERCGMKYNLVRNLGLPEVPSLAARFGSDLIHPVLSNWYLTGGKYDADWDELWADFTDKLTPTDLAGDNAHTKSNAIKACEKYIKTYANDYDEYRVVASEEVYWAVLPNSKTIWASKPDLVLARRLDDKLVSADFKSSVWDIHAKLNPFDRQFLGQAHNTGADYMMKLHILLPRYDKDKKGKPPEVELLRSIEPVDADLLAEWVADTRLSGDTIRLSHTAGVWPKRAPGSCLEFRRKCEFRDNVCPMGSTRQSVIDGMDKTNPMEYLGL